MLVILNLICLYLLPAFEVIILIKSLKGIIVILNARNFTLSEHSRLSEDSLDYWFKFHSYNGALPASLRMHRNDFAMNVS